jgi:alpha-ketoglutarate-dependent taurine dioxygenase
MPIPSGLSERLQQHGWVLLGSNSSRGLGNRMTDIARHLGTIADGPTARTIQTIAPRDQGAAPVSSLSHQFGLGPFPLHNDTAHWTLPCRYVILACAEVGSVRAPTLLADAHDPGFSDDERLLLHSSTFLVRNGGKSFYASLLDSRRRFIRFDPGCMEPMTTASVTAMQLYGMRRQRSRVIACDWEEGNVLIIDNWRMLHGRGNDVPADPQRRLLRVYVR